MSISGDTFIAVQVLTFTAIKAYIENIPNGVQQYKQSIKHRDRSTTNHVIITWSDPSSHTCQLTVYYHWAWISRERISVTPGPFEVFHPYLWLGRCSFATAHLLGYVKVQREHLSTWWVSLMGIILSFTFFIRGSSVDITICAIFQLFEKSIQWLQSPYCVNSLSRYHFGNSFTLSVDTASSNQPWMDKNASDRFWIGKSVVREDTVLYS